jgi:hypothetical protein
MLETGERRAYNSFVSETRSPRAVDAWLGAAACAGAGSGLWIWAAEAAGRTEAWDGPYYFSRVIPALWLCAGACGFLVPRGAWRWPAVIYLSQFITMIVRTEGTVGPLAPLGFIMMGVLALVTAVPTYLGVLARRVSSRA